MEALTREEIDRFLAVRSGSGSGSGYGYGDGSGDGYGSGDGDGSGYGSGYGYGDGYGYGSGSGDGSGDILKFCGHLVVDIDNTPTILYSIHRNYAHGAILNSDLSLSECHIAKAGNYFAHGGTLREARRAAEAKRLKNEPLEDKIARFIKTHPDLDNEYGDLFDWHHILTGSCEFGRKEWCKEHGYQPTDSITVRDFIRLTKFDYGGHIIEQLEKEYQTK